MNSEIIKKKCKGCHKELSINVIRNHLAQKSSCKNEYSQEEEAELERLYVAYRRNKRAKDYQDKKEKANTKVY